MLFNLSTSLIDQYSFLNVFKHLTFRTGLSAITSLIVVFIIGGPLIKIFSENMITGPIRQDGPIDHIIKKSGTPTMGGVIIIIGIVFSTLLWADLSNIYVWTLVFVSLSLGALGLLDDVLKIRLKNSRGLKSRYKFLGQLVISAIALFIIIKFSDHNYIYNDTKINLKENTVLSHSHQQYIRYVKNFLLINPGSLGQNRYYINVANYIIWDTETGEFQLKYTLFKINLLINEMKFKKFPKVCIDYYKSKNKN